MPQHATVRPSERVRALIAATNATLETLLEEVQGNLDGLEYALQFALRHPDTTRRARECAEHRRALNAILDNPPYAISDKYRGRMAKMLGHLELLLNFHRAGASPVQGDGGHGVAPHNGVQALPAVIVRNDDGDDADYAASEAESGEAEVVSQAVEDLTTMEEEAKAEGNLDHAAQLRRAIIKTLSESLDGNLQRWETRSERSRAAVAHRCHELYAKLKSCIDSWTTVLRLKVEHEAKREEELKHQKARADERYDQEDYDRSAMQLAEAVEHRERLEAEGKALQALRQEATSRMERLGRDTVARR